jgi:hypothetical protein
MADTAHKVQLNVLVSREAHHLLRQIYESKIAAIGAPISLGAFVEMWIRHEAKRQGFLKKRATKASK